MELAFFCFILKHFLCDFPLQNHALYHQKGIYGHWAGIYHAGTHGLGTAIICLFFGFPLWFGLLDMVIHYHIDWCKVRLNARYGLTPQNKYWWWLLGLDQFLHYSTYAALLWLAHNSLG